MSTMTKPRLTKESWIKAGLDALGADGPEALKAEPLARRLKTTKGSFYWHFKDVPDFHRALLTHWQTRARIPAESDNPVIALRGLATALAQTDAAEPAIRAWAKGSATAAASLAKVDAERLDQLQLLLSEIGIANPEMAHILYAAALGMRDMQSGGDTSPEAMGTLVDLVLALR